MNLGRLRHGLQEITFINSLTDVKLFYKHKLSYYLKKLAATKGKDLLVPVALQLEPTNNCSLNCICCSRDKMRRRMGYMDFSLFKKIIRDTADIGIKRVHLYLHGEPLLHPQISDMIRYIKQKDLAITMATNGMPLNTDKMRAILQSGVNSADYFIFSILGYSEETHQRVMRGVNHYRVLTNLHQFIELREREKVNGPMIDTIFYRMEENQKEERDFIHYWQKYVDYVRVSDISQQFRGSAESLPFRRTTCDYLWDRMTVYWNGDVTICNADINGDYILGSLTNGSIKDIWRCDNMLNIKGIHKRGAFDEISLCSKCDR